MTQYASILACLNETPYQLPERFQVVDRLAVALERERRVQERLSAALETLRKSGLFAVVAPFQESKEIFESNALEGLGPNLRQTHEILSSAGSTVEEALAELASD